MDKENEQLKGFLEKYVERITPRAIKPRGAYVCPLCGSGDGDGDNSDSAFSIYDDGKKWHCFSCGRSGDIFDLIGSFEGIPDYNAQLEKARELFATDKEPNKNQPKTEQEKTIEKEPNYTRFCAVAHSLADKYDYFQKRGFSKAIIDRFNLGYDDTDGYVRAIIPVNEHHYIIRGTTDGYKANSKGKAGLFNLKALYNDENAPVFICEGWADALSIEEAGGYAIALNGVSNANKLLTYLNSKPNISALLVATDNDEAGEQCANALIEGLANLGYIVDRFEPAQPYKDLNEWFTADKDGFTISVENAQKGVIDDTRRAYQENYIGAQLDTILSDILGGKHGAVSTGYKCLDNALDGGLCAGLTVLASESSLGKSTLIMNIAENLAEQGRDILYFALEMSKAQIVARGLSKQSFLNGDPYTASQIRKNQFSDLTPAINSYKKIAEHLIIVESFEGMTALDINDRIEEHIRITGKVPVIVVDYLQMIYDGEHATDKQQLDYSVGILKGISAKHNAVVLAISSLNRASYGDRVSLESLKESGKIEYSADVVLGLNLKEHYNEERKGAKMTKDEISAELQNEPRLMTVEILKGRDIAIRGRANFAYYSAYSYYRDLDEDVNGFMDETAAYQRFKA